MDNYSFQQYLAELKDKEKRKEAKDNLTAFTIILLFLGTILSVRIAFYLYTY